MVFAHRDLDKEKKKETNDLNISTDSGNVADISSTSIEVEIESEVDGKKVTSRVMGTATPIIGSAVIEQETMVSCDFYFHFFFRIYLLPKDRNIIVVCMTVQRETGHWETTMTTDQKILTSAASMAAILAAWCCGPLISSSVGLLPPAKPRCAAATDALLFLEFSIALA